MHAPFALGLAWPVDHLSTVAAFYRAPGRPPAVQLPSLFVVIRAPAEPEEREGTLPDAVPKLELI